MWIIHHVAEQGDVDRCFHTRNHSRQNARFCAVFDLQLLGFERGEIDGLLHGAQGRRRLDRNLQDDRHTGGNTAQNAAVIVGRRADVTVIVDVKAVVILAADHASHIKSGTEFQTTHARNAENKLPDGVFNAVKNRRTDTSRHIHSGALDDTAKRFTASRRSPDILQHFGAFVKVDDREALGTNCHQVVLGDVHMIELVVTDTVNFERMGADVSITHIGSSGKEPYGIISGCYTEQLRGCEIPADKIPSIVDEVPVLSLVAATASGITVFRGVTELRMKETDRIDAIIEGLGILGVEAWMNGDDLFVEGQPGLQIPEGLVLDSCKDHRMAMTWALAGLCLNTSVTVSNFDSVKVSYPEFLSTFERLMR